MHTSNHGEGLLSGIPLASVMSAYSAGGKWLNRTFLFFFNDSDSILSGGDIHEVYHAQQRIKCRCKKNIYTHITILHAFAFSWKLWVLTVYPLCIASFFPLLNVSRHWLSCCHTKAIIFTWWNEEMGRVRKCGFFCLRDSAALPIPVLGINWLH